jgi:hypothetical protein
MYKTSAFSSAISAYPLMRIKKSGSTMMPARQFAKGRLVLGIAIISAWFSRRHKQQWHRRRRQTGPSCYDGPD